MLAVVQQWNVAALELTTLLKLLHALPCPADPGATTLPRLPRCRAS